MTELVTFADTVKYLRQSGKIRRCVNDIFYIQCCNFQYKDNFAYSFERIHILIREKQKYINSIINLG